jgi:transposase-like protein
MILHANAALSRRQRERLVSLVVGGATITAAALVVGCSRQTASKWVGRARRGEGLEDRSSRPQRSPRQTPAAVEQAVLRARAELRLGPHPLGWALGLAASTVHAILRRNGCSRLKPRMPRDAIVRYERELPGELVHVDVKKLGRIIRPGHRVTGDRSRRAKGKAGWLYLFAAIDDATRLGFAQLHPDETADSALAFLAACGLFYGHHGIRIERVLTDNGTCFKRRWAEGCQARAISRSQDAPRSAPNQRQGRALHPHDARALGLRLPLRRRTRALSRPSARPRLVQSLPQTPRPRRTHTPSARQQPLWDEHLAARSRLAR